MISVLRSNARKSEPPSSTVSMAGVQRQGFSIVQIILAMKTGELDYRIDDSIDGRSRFKQFISFKISEIA